MKIGVVVLLLGVVSSASAQSAPAPLRLSLTDALLRADSASPTVGIARAGTTSAEASWLRARAARLPQVNGAVTYTRTLASEFSGFAGSTSSDSFPAPTNCTHYHPNPSLPIADRLDSLEHGLDCTANGSSLDFSKLPFGRPNQWNFALSGSQSLFDLRLARQQAAANAGRDQAAIELDAQRAQAVLNMAQAYFDAQLAQRLLDIADSTLAQADRTLAQTRLEHQVGNAAEFDQLRASVARDNQNPVVIQRRAQRDQAFLRLRQLLDVPQRTPLELVTPLTDTTEVVLPAFAASIAARGDTALDARAPVREAAAGLDAGNAQLGAARAERLPALSLSSTYAKIDFPEHALAFGSFLTDWEVNVQLTIPIFNGGRLHADALTAEAARETAAMRLKQARQQAELEAVDARMQLDAAQSEWQASLGTSQQAQRAYAIAELRYRNGLSTLVDVSDARVQLSQAEANNAQAARDLQVARLRLALLPSLPFAGQGAAATTGASNAGTAGTTTPAAGSTASPTSVIRTGTTTVPTGGG